MITRLTGIRRRAFGIGLSSYHDVAQLIRHHDHLAGRPSLEELLHLGILQHRLGYLTMSLIGGVAGACCSGMEEAGEATGPAPVMIAVWSSMATNRTLS